MTSRRNKKVTKPQARAAGAARRKICDLVRDRRLELLEPPQADDPHDGALGQLRQHLRDCSRCQDELDAIQALLDVGLDIMCQSSSLTEGPEVEAALQAGEDRLLSHLRRQATGGMAGNQSLVEEP